MLAQHIQNDFVHYVLLPLPISQAFAQLLEAWNHSNELLHFLLGRWGRSCPICLIVFEDGPQKIDGATFYV